MVNEVLRPPERMAATQQRRAAHREQFFRHQLGDFEAGPASLAVANRHIDFMAAEVDTFVGGQNTHVDLGMKRAEMLEARHQPLGGKGIEGGDRERARIGALHQPCRRARQSVERLTGRRKILGALLGQADGAVEAAEERQAEPLLKRFDLVADRRLGHVQFVRSMSKIKVPSRRFKGSHCI